MTDILLALLLAGLLLGAYFLGEARGGQHEREFRLENRGERDAVCGRFSPFPPRRPRPAAETPEEKRARTIYDNIEAYGTSRAQQEVE